MTNFRNLAIVEPTVRSSIASTPNVVRAQTKFASVEPLDIDEVMANLLIDLDLNDTVDDDLNDTVDDDMISVPGLVEDLGYLGDCEDIINKWNCE